MTARRVRFDIRRAGKPLLAALAVLALVDIALYAGLVRPKVREWNALNEVNSPRAQALRAKQDRVEGLERFVDGLKQARADLDRLRTEVLSTREQRMIDVQRELETLARAHKVNLELVTYEHDVLPAEDLEVLRMVLPLEGGYGALRGLLEAVERSDKFIVVERVTIGQGRDGGVLLQLNVTLATYFDAPDVPAAARVRGRV